MFNFPDASKQTEFTLGTRTWKWNGSYWEILKQTVVSNGISYFQQDDSPTTAKLGDRWLNTQNLTEYVYVQIAADPDSYQWLDLVGDYPGDSLLGE
jgi:hypothetical protein